MHIQNISSISAEVYHIENTVPMTSHVVPELSSPAPSSRLAQKLPFAEAVPSNRPQIPSVRVDYWQLTPTRVESINEEPHYSYEATILSRRQEGAFFEMLLQINSKDFDRNTQVWVKIESTNPELYREYEFGKTMDVKICPYQTDVIFLPGEICAIPCWEQKDFASWIVSEQAVPLTNKRFYFDGVSYIAYAGKITDHSYHTRIWENSDAQWICHHLGMSVRIQGDEITRAVSIYRESSIQTLNSQGRRLNGPDDFPDEILKALRNWDLSNDQIKIFINEYYPGNWWILNESKNEALYMVDGALRSMDRDLWSHYTG